MEVDWRRLTASTSPLQLEEGTTYQALNNLPLKNGSNQGQKLALTVLSTDTTAETGYGREYRGFHALRNTRPSDCHVCAEVAGQRRAAPGVRGG